MLKCRVSGNADVAQLVEQLIRNQQVIGSSPIAGSKISRKVCRLDVHDRSHSQVDPLSDPLAENRFHVARSRRSRLLLQVAVQIRGHAQLGMSE